jgi:hypothetical protein
MQRQRRKQKERERKIKEGNIGRKIAKKEEKKETRRWKDGRKENVITYLRS